MSLLGPLFAIFRPLAAFITGVIGGGLVSVFDQNAEGENQKPPKCSDECCDSTKNNRRITRGLKFGFITLPRDIGRAMLVGLAVAAVISALIPDGYFAEKIGTGIFAMVVMMFLGIPVYVCATASIPVAAALILKGLTPGAALVFLITGPATNAATFTTIWKALGGRTAIVYLLTVAVSALGAGMLLDLMFPDLGPSVRTHLHQMEPSILGHISAVVLLAVLGFAILSKAKRVKDGNK